MFRPIVLLPTIVVTGLSSEQLVVVFGHELDHIRRNDLIVNLLQRIVESLLFFHPVVWFISRQMSDAQESCCDDLVVAAGCERMAYAGALLRMAELCCVKKAVMPTTVAASGQNPGQFERRIERMIDGHQSDQLQVTRAGFLTAIGFFLLTAGAGLLQGGGDSDNESDPESAIIDAQPTQSNLSVKLSEAVDAINLEVSRLPFRVDVDPLQVADVVARIQQMGSSDQELTTDEQNILRQDAPGAMLPEEVTLRSYVRYDTGSSMKHGSWVRVLVRAESGPVGADLRSVSAFERPHTQLERINRAEARARGGTLLLNHLVTYFREDPHAGERDQYSRPDRHSCGST